MTSEAAPTAGQFYVLAFEERRPLYEATFGQTYPARYFGNVLELILGCFDAPPTAVVIDVPTSARMGEETAPLYNLQIGWTILRCSSSSKGELNALSFEPAYKGALTGALQSLTRGDTTWKHPRFPRRDLRLGLHGRLRLRVQSEDRWRLANCNEIGTSTLTAITYEPPEVGERVLLELRDVFPELTQFEAVVAWRRLWDESPEAPAVGFTIPFIDDTIKQQLIAMVRKDLTLAY